MIRKNDIVNIQITDMTQEGLGIGHAESMAVFVKDTVIGDVITAVITKCKKSYAYGRLLEVRTPSPDRIPARCPVARACGGCQLQMMRYEAQLSYKQEKVRNCLIRIGGFDAEMLPMEEIMGMEVPWHYRNKAQFPVGTDKNGRLIAGFYAGRTHHIVETADCLLGIEANSRIVSIVLRHMETYRISAYDETIGKGEVRHIMTRCGFATGQIMVVIIANADHLEREDLLAEELFALPGVAGVLINTNKEQTNVIFGEKTRLIRGSSYIEDLIGDIRYRISARSFYQVNPLQTKRLYDTVLEYAGLSGNETVWDLYCGIGTISLFLARKAKQVYGVEIIPEAVTDAAANAALNKITNVSFFPGKAEEVMPQKVREEGLRGDVVVVDPPRKGCDLVLLQTIIDMAPQKVVYVSCDPATLARDLKILCGNGYELRSIRPCDMFGQGIHVETVCLLSKLSEARHHISVQVDMDELDLTAAESKATYEEIQEWVQEKYGFHVTHLNIAKTKRKCGIIERQNYNLPKNEDSRSPETPKEKEEAIMDAFLHFKMI